MGKEEIFLYVFVLLFLIVVFPDMGKFLLRIIAFPYFIWKWHRKKKIIKRRKNNYELLGNYIAIFANNSEVLKHLKKLIEDGISEIEFQKLLENNITNLQNFEIEKEKILIRAKLEEESDFKKMASEQQEILIQSKLSLEQIKFRENLISGLVEKIQEKYKL